MLIYANTCLHLSAIIVQIDSLEEHYTLAAGLARPFEGGKKLI